MLVLCYIVCMCNTYLADFMCVIVFCLRTSMKTYNVVDTAILSKLIIIIITITYLMANHSNLVTSRSVLPTYSYMISNCMGQYANKLMLTI